MRRFSISRLMLLIAVIAANFGIFRFLLSPSRGGRNWHYQLPAGFLPLVDASLVAVFLLLRRNRVSLMRRPRGPGRFALPFITTIAGFLAAVAVSYFCAYEALTVVLRAVTAPVESVFQSLGAGISMDTPAERYLVGPIFLAVTLSAAPLAFALALAALLSRFQILVTPKEERCGASAPSP